METNKDLLVKLLTYDIIYYSCLRPESDEALKLQETLIDIYSKLPEEELHKILKTRL